MKDSPALQEINVTPQQETVMRGMRQLVSDLLSTKEAALETTPNPMLVIPVNCPYCDAKVNVLAVKWGHLMAAKSVPDHCAHCKKVFDAEDDMEIRLAVQQHDDAEPDDDAPFYLDAADYLTNGQYEADRAQEVTEQLNAHIALYDNCDDEGFI